MMAADASGQPERVYAEANRLAKLGISVIPIAAGTKEPPVGFRWGKYAHEAADASERYTWFIEQGHQLAVVPGTISGNLVPLDYDSPTGFESHAAQYPIIREFPRIRTGSGKTHVWVRTARPVKKYVCTTPDGGKLEVRAGTHYTLCPPSLHPSGKHYAWEREPWGGIPVIDLADIGLKMIDPTEQEQREPISEGEPLTDAEKAHIVEMIDPHYIPDHRHEICLALAGWLAGHGVPEIDAQALVRTLALNHGDQERVREYVRGVRDTYRKAREGVAVAGWARLNDRDRPLIDDSTAKRLDLLLRHRNPIFSFEPERKSDDTPWIISVEDFLGEPDEPEDWIVEGLILKPTVTLVCGPPKTFKSLLVQELAIATASGTSAFGVFTVKEPRTVIYIQEESSRGALRRRFKTALLGRGMHPAVFEGRLQIVTNKEFQLDNPAHIEALVRQGIEAHGAALCIFDPLVEMHNVNENTDEMRPILRVFKRIRNDYGVSSIVVHHNNKNPLATSNAGGIRGWSGIWGMMDGGIFVKDDDSDPAQKRIEVTLKEGGQAEPFLFRPDFSDGAMRFNVVDLAPSGKTISDVSIVRTLEQNGWVDAVELAGLLGVSDRRLRPRIAAMVERGQIQMREQRSGRATKRVYGAPGASDDDPDF